MTNSKVFLILATLSKQEFKLFKDFLASPLYNKNQRFLDFYTILKTYHPNYQELKQEEIYKKTFPTLPFNQKKLNNLISEMNQLLERFIEYLRFEKDPALKTKARFEAFFDRNLHKHFLSSRKKNLKNQANLLQSVDGLYHDFYMTELDHRTKIRKESLSLDANIDKVMQGFDVYYFANKLRYSCVILNEKFRRTIDYDMLLNDELLKIVVEPQYQAIPLIRLYYQLFLCLSNNDKEAYFFNIKDELLKVQDALAEPEVKTVYNMLIGYCVSKTQQGKFEYFEELFIIYEQLIERKFIFAGAYIVQSHYANAVGIGLRLKKYDWVFAFMEQYHEQLHPDFHDTLYHYYLANWYFRQGQYNETRSELLKVDLINPFYYMLYRKLLAQSYYILLEYNSLFSLVQNSKEWLKRNKNLSKAYKDSYHNFFTIILQIARMRLRGDKKFDKMKDKINAMKLLIEKAWLLNMVEALRNKKTTM